MTSQIRDLDAVAHLHALIGRLKAHPEYHHCFSLAGAEIEWETTRQTDDMLIGYTVDMSQFHALNHNIGREATNARVRAWLQLLRVSDLIAGGGDEFLIVVRAGDDVGFFQRLQATLRQAGLYGYVTYGVLDTTRALLPQMEQTLDVIHAAKERDLPPKWQFWRLNSRVRCYQLGETVLV